MSEYLPPEAGKVLILAPHHDDETIGCGGTIALYASHGAEVRLIVISDGKKISFENQIINSDISYIRREETVQAAKILGIQQTYFLDFPDGELNTYKDEIEKKIKDIIIEFKPNIIFSPSPIDFHPDHIACSKISLLLKNKFPQTQLAFYEVYNTIRFNKLVDISEFIHIKERAFQIYKCSLFNCPDLFLNAVKGVNIFRSFYTKKERYYEAFWVISEAIDSYTVMKWLTYESWMEPAEIFFSKLKVTDELIFELKKSYDLLNEKEAIIKNLINQLDDKDRQISNLKISIDNINNSLMWKLVNRFYKVRDSLLPSDSLRRKIYEIVISQLKSRIR